MLTETMEPGEVGSVQGVDLAIFIHEACQLSNALLHDAHCTLYIEQFVLRMVRRAMCSMHCALRRYVPHCIRVVRVAIACCVC